MMEVERATKLVLMTFSSSPRILTSGSAAYEPTRTAGRSRIERRRSQLRNQFPENESVVA
jgi:hypothetical protein